MEMGSNLVPQKPDPDSFYLQKFRLYETRSNFYIIGRDKSRTFWRVLKIERLELTELSVLEDPTLYSESECCDLLRRIHEGNKSTGGLKFVTTCYGIIGFIKFLGPYYMLLITKRRKIGAICGHTIYAITRSEIIPIPNSTVRSNMTNSKTENRYKKLLCMVDLTKDFFFSYSYNVMHSLQKNLCSNQTGQVHYETMFVWNEFLTRGIHNSLNNTLWTVALVYGFFKQVKLSVSGRSFKLTLIARRSRHYAGTRYLKRGVNEKGRVANDVETEQIVFEDDVPEGYPVQISSIVQIRGSIPLFWSQETSRLNLKPDILLSKMDQNYEATKLHFENLVKRYGNPIIILNLIKTHEKKPRETILRAEFANAIRFINKGLSEENRLRFLHWDLHRHSRKATNVLALLGRVAAYALNFTGIFYCQVTPRLMSNRSLNWSFIEKNDADSSLENPSSEDGGASKLDFASSNVDGDTYANQNVKDPQFQSGVLRTNCIDCLDRTNVAQYAYGLVALGRQLDSLGLMESPNIDLDNPLAEDLMGIYENMGDTLAQQYGGSAAHNKVFSQRRGQWKAATQSQEFLRTLQRYYSNAYMDAEKQDAINVFLGHFQPQQGKPALWELNSDQHYNVGRHGSGFDENARSFIKRSLSDGSLLVESDSIAVSTNVGQHKPLSESQQGINKSLSSSNPEISTCEISYARYTSSMSHGQIFRDVGEDQDFENNHICYDRHGNACSCSNFLDLDWISSSGNSCEEDLYDRSISDLSSEDLANGLKSYVSTSASESGSSMKGRNQAGAEVSSADLGGFSERFVNWVNNGEMLFL